MIYLDAGATSLRKPKSVARAVSWAMEHCANPGRGGYSEAMEAARVIFDCREKAGKLFDCPPERVVFTSNCTHGLNIAIRSLVKPGDRVVVSGFEHNAVTRTLHALGAEVIVAGRKLFDWEDTLREFEQALTHWPRAVVFTHVSNVFGYVLPVEQMAELCRQRGIPFILDAAQSAGSIGLSMEKLGAAYIAMPGHKGLLGPQGTGMLLCGEDPAALICGGTGSDSIEQAMPAYLPDRLEAGTVNVPGIAGLGAGLDYLLKNGVERIGRREHRLAERCAKALEKMGCRVFQGPNQAATVSFLMKKDCQWVAEAFARRGIALRAGLHCAPLAHESAGTLETGTVRASFGYGVTEGEVERFLQAANKVMAGKS